MWKYKIGTVVREKDARPMFGHIVGFSNNGFQTILKVQWDDESVREIHATNIFVEGEVQ
jgi:hypothetical protein